MSKFIKVNKRELLFFISYFLLGLANTIVNSYLAGDSRLQIYEILLYLAAFFEVATLFVEKQKIKDFIIKIAFLAVGALVAVQMHKIALGMYILLIIIAINVDPKKILQTTVINNIFFLLIVVIPSLLGLIENATVGHLGNVAHCYGFQYYSNIPIMVFMITMFMYVLADSKKKEFVVLIVSLPIQYVVYKFCTVRLIFAIYLFFMGLALLENFYDRTVKHRLMSLIASVMYPVACAFTVIVSLIYEKSSLLTKFDLLCNSRFCFNKIGFERYGISLFGTKIEINRGLEDVGDYFYIDSAYIFTLLSYGIIFFVFILILYSIYSKKLVENREIKMLIVCIIICLYSIFNNVIFNLIVNPVPLIAFQYLLASKKKKLKFFYN